MSFETQMAADIAEIFGDAEGPTEGGIHRRPAVGATPAVETGCRLIVERIRTAEAMFADGASDQELAILHVPVATIPTVEATDEFDVLPVGGTVVTTWKVLGIRNENTAVREVEVLRSTRTRWTDGEFERDRSRGASMVRRT